MSTQVFDPNIGVNPVIAGAASTPRFPSRPPAPSNKLPAQPPARRTSREGSTGGDGGGPTVNPQATTGGGGETGIPAFGTQIQVLVSPGPPEEWATIAGVGDITGPNTSVAEVETTSHSTGSPHRTFIPTLIDDGELTFPDFWNPTDPTQSMASTYGLEYLFQNRIVTKFRLINSDQGHRTRVFKGFVRNLGETYPVQGVCTRNVTIRITSVPTETASPIAMTPATGTATATGGPGTFDVTVGGAVSASWMPVSDVPWITIVDPIVPVWDDDTVDYTVEAQAPAAPARVGHIMIAALGLTFQIDQAAGV